MALTVSTSGSGSARDIMPGWRVEEYATPASPIDSAGGTGGVSFSAGASPVSLLLAGSESTCAVEMLGSVSGYIKSASQSGNLACTLSQSNKLARLDADVSIPPIYAGSIAAALDAVDQLTGTIRLSQNSGAFFSMSGHGIGFDSAGEKVEFEQGEATYSYYNSVSGLFESSSAQYAKDAFYSANFSALDGKQYAVNPTGDSFVIVDAGRTDFWVGSKNSFTKNRIAFKTALNGQDFSLSWSGGPDSSSMGTGQSVTVSIDYSAATVTTSATYRSAGLFVDTTDTQSLSSIISSSELAIFVEFHYDRTSLPVPNAYEVYVTVCNAANLSSLVRSSIRYAPDGLDVWFQPMQFTGNVRSIWRSEQYFGSSWDSSFTPMEWENPAAFVVSGTFSPSTPVVAFEGNAWQYIQSACVAYRWEIVLDSDTITARPLGSATVDISNHVGSPALSANLSYTGRQVNVEYSNSKSVYSEEFYNARDDSNRIISVNAGEEVRTSVQANGYPLSLTKPTRTTTFVPGQGKYFVVDSTGLPIVANQWEQYGGNVRVELNSSVTGGIDVIVSGPITEIPSTTAPYSLAVSDGENLYAALSILGTGVKSAPSTLELLTGADRSKTYQQIATTVVNPFVSSVSQAYDIGIITSVDSSGPIMQLSLDASVRHISGLGVTPGSLIRWGSSIYRVTSCDIGATQVSLECKSFVTVAEFDSTWASKSVAEHDALWGSYPASAQKIFPLSQDSVG